VGKALNASLTEEERVINPDDALWLKQEKLKIQKYTDPKNHMLMD
jgi:hypothetical protein